MSFPHIPTRHYEDGYDGSWCRRSLAGIADGPEPGEPDVADLHDDEPPRYEEHEVDDEPEPEPGVNPDGSWDEEYWAEERLRASDYASWAEL